jgi:hypothetical protein
MLALYGLRQTHQSVPRFAILGLSSQLSLIYGAFSRARGWVQSASLRPAWQLSRGTVGEKASHFVWQHLSAEFLDDVSGQYGNSFPALPQCGLVSRTIFSR